MNVELQPFQESIQKVRCQISQQKEEIKISYEVELSGYIELWEKLNSSLERKIGLWEGTCFEAFIKDPKSERYLEFNFSGTGLWNCFYFEEKGQELKEHVSLQISSHRFISRPRKRIFSFSIPKKDIDFLMSNHQLDIGLSTILMDDDEHKEYFSIKHLKDKPDFHDENTYLNIDLNDCDS